MANTSYKRSYNGTRALPTTTGNYIEICTIKAPFGAKNIRLRTFVDQSGFSTAKEYLFSISYASAAAYQLLSPISVSKYTTAQDYELEIVMTTDTATIRINRTAGTDAATLYYSIDFPDRRFWLYGSIGTVTDITGTGAAAVSTIIYASSLPNRNPYGSMYLSTPNTQINCTLNTWIAIGSGMSTGPVYNTTFQNSRELKILTPGNYLANYSATGRHENHEAVMNAGVYVNTTIQTVTISNGILADHNQGYSGTGIITLATNDVVTLAFRNTTDAADLYLDTANLTLSRISI